MQSRQLWNTGPLYMCAVGCCEVADACGVPCRLSLSRLFIYLLTYLRHVRHSTEHHHAIVLCHVLHAWIGLGIVMSVGEAQIIKHKRGPSAS